MQIILSVKTLIIIKEDQRWIINIYLYILCGVEDRESKKKQSGDARRRRRITQNQE